MSDITNSIVGLAETGLVAGVALKSLEFTGKMFSSLSKQSETKKESNMPKKKHNNAFDFSSFDNPFDFRF